ncbi:AP-3 complex subunit sigma-2 [Cymbomonas tetramitiformis]|uniref:AP complex subunit sigma n=1 Tax=Cymbomonas tetramitiformis TaxID=36881 RepID=A0AAE0CCI9_9CHLO|nr:AP-3 complex subunit sigma-2 [Cymbomonas tetramitiformis]
MIKSILVVNNHGKPRLVKFYDRMPMSQQQEWLKHAFNLVSKRADHLCSFVEDEEFFGKDSRLIYRHFATLYFIVICDSSESELGILDLIQVMVETLDKNFESVCELDLIFHCPKVHTIIDEIVMGGMVLETNCHEVLRATAEIAKLEKASETVNYSKSKSGPQTSKFK